MDERDMMLALTPSRSVEEAKSLLQHLKTAGSAKEKALQFIAQHQHEMLGGLLGAGLAGGAQYLSSRPGKDGKSSEQKMWGNVVRSQEEARERALAEGKEEGFAKKTLRPISKAMKEMSDVFAEHPVKGALMTAPMGVSAGIQAARYLKSKG